MKEYLKLSDIDIPEIHDYLLSLAPNKEDQEDLEGYFGGPVFVCTQEELSTIKSVYTDFSTYDCVTKNYNLLFVDANDTGGPQYFYPSIPSSLSNEHKYPVKYLRENLKAHKVDERTFKWVMLKVLEEIAPNNFYLCFILNRLGEKYSDESVISGQIQAIKNIIINELLEEQVTLEDYLGIKDSGPSHKYRVEWINAMLKKLEE